ncbi:lipid II flippase MurJ [Microbacterium proteolyticum]|uniref:murein biosynthesis integral membrane protein MurJ n=1 Tax=Microbacterium proteolyticum TaxID=1572644 RepID=UPI002416568B|nr:lipid II flippase MurJ [Microbacterium proteolyticum]
MSGGTGRTVLSASTATLISRIIGFVRNLSLAAALGTGIVSDSYNLANQVPNQIFLLLGGGTIAAVFLPQITRLATRSREDADRYGTVLLLGSAAFGLVISGVALAFAPQVVSALGGSAWGTSQRELTIALFLWCTPQIAAYAVFSVASQLMNARGKFTLVSWLPAVSSLSVIAGSAIVIVNGTVNGNDPTSVSPELITVLGATTLGGTIVQLTALLILLRRVGFRARLRGGIRGLGLRIAVRTGVLSVASAMCYQATNLLTAAWTAQAGTTASEQGFEGFGYSAFFFAMALISVVQGIAGSSLSSILLQRMAKHFGTGDVRAAHGELDDALLRLSSFIIPVASIMIACGPAIGEILFARGQTSPSAARMIGVTVAILATGLLPYSLHALLIRPFYANHDGLRPLLSSITVNAIWAIGAVLAFFLLPAPLVLFGMALTFAISYWADLPIKMIWLRRRLDYRVEDARRGAMLRGVIVGAILTVVIGAPGWYALFVFDLPTWAALIVAAVQATLLIAVYTLAVRRSLVSPIALLRWLRK